MRKFTDKELKLAPMAAEVVGPWEPKVGDLCLPQRHKRVKVVLQDGILSPHKEWEEWPLRSIKTACTDSTWDYYDYTKALWLPLEHDCLEWLRGRGSIVISMEPTHPWFICIRSMEGEWNHQGDTLLEALYNYIIEAGANA